jgi:hypothetical protein
MVNRIFYPHTLRNKIVSQKGLAVAGTGMGSGFLLDGGKGHQNSYIDYDTYVKDTKGQGLGKSIVNKLTSLNVKPMKPMKKLENIQFHM